MLADHGLHARHGGLRGADSFSQFGLREPGFGTRFQYLVQKFELFRKRIVLATHVGPRQRACPELLKTAGPHP
jgi:hypothetical protein